MKNSFLILLLILLALESHTISSSITSEPGTSFKLQTDDRNRLTMFLKADPVNVTVELNVTELNAKLIMYYDEPLGDQTYKVITIEIGSSQYYTYTINTNKIMLILENNANNYANSTATGNYRIHSGSTNENLTWMPFKLLLSTPDSIDLFRSEGSWINNVTIDLQITELIGGKLFVEHANSDVINLETITEIGNYSYLVNTSFITLSLQSTNYSRVVGYYTLVDNGKMYEFNMIGFSFETMAIITLSIVVAVKVKRNSIR